MSIATVDLLVMNAACLDTGGVKEMMPQRMSASTKGCDFGYEERRKYLYGNEY